MSNRYIIQRTNGGPEVLELAKGDIPTPQEGELVVKHEAIGFNLIDTYFRKGIYPKELPYVGGSEGAGTVHAIGPKVEGFKVGDRVAYSSSGSYADYNTAKAFATAKLPENISFDVAAASLLKGLTVQYLIEKIYVPKQDEIVLYHSGAGGVGLIFLQWAKYLGVKVITTVSTDEKAEIARANGAWHVLKYSDDIPAKVKELTEGKKLKVVYDSAGKDTFEKSLDSLAPRGLLVAFGNASGPIPPFSPSILTSKGSLFLTRPSLFDYIEDFQAQADAFFKLVTDGKIKIHVNHTYSLEDLASAHRDVEARKTTGSVVLHP